MKEQIFISFEPQTGPGLPAFGWAGKRPLRSVVSPPACLREVYGPAREGWRNRLYWGENLQVMGHLLQTFRGKIDLIYLDPPFDSSADYKRTITLRGGTPGEERAVLRETQYGDTWICEEYLQFMYERLILMRELLSPRGSLYLHCDYRRSHYLRMLLDEVFGPGCFRNEILWCYSIGGKGERFFGRKHDSIFWYSKTQDYYFDGKSPHVAARRKPNSHMKLQTDAAGRQYQEKRDRKSGKVYRYYIDEGKIPEDYWTDIEQLNREDRERVGYPTQKPEALLKRIIAASAPPGGLVFDPFMGSGTTQAAAMKLDRRFLGADSNPGAVETVTRRLLTAGRELEGTPGFGVYQVGRSAPQRPAAGAEAVRVDGRLVIRAFRPARLLEKLSLPRETDWRRLVDSVMIDWHYEGAVLRPETIDIPEKNALVRGVYDIPEDCGTIRVKITDLRSESMEIEVP